MKASYQIDTAENKAYVAQLAEELLQFGTRFPSPCGASFYLGDDGTPWKERPVETWITCRMAHVYSIGAMLHGADEAGVLYRKLAAEAIRGLLGDLKDTVNGGWYPGLTADGTILPEKQCYAHAFVILAASSATLAGIKGAEQLLKEALDTYDRFFWDDACGLAVDTYDTGFQKPDDYRGVNANMHTVEAFLATADALGEEKYRERAGRVIDHVIAWAKDNDWRIPEHFKKDWTPDLEKNKTQPDDPFKPYGATPGHGIEWARLITQWALSTQEHAVDAQKSAGGQHAADEAFSAQPYIEAAEQLFTRAIADAWCADGERGIVYTTDWSGKPVVHDRMHWTLMEAINTSAVLYRVTGKDAYAARYAEFMAYMEEVVHDPVHGSFYHQLDEHNQIKGTVWPGKSDLYHAFQAMLIPYGDPAVSVASEVARKTS